MGLFEQQFPDTGLTMEGMQSDLADLEQCFDALEMDCGILDRPDDLALPMLLAQLGSEDEEGNALEPVVLAVAFLPMPKEVLTETKLLQLTMDVPTDINGLDSMVLLELVNYCNVNTPGISLLILDKEPAEGEGRKLTLRMTQAAPLTARFDYPVMADLVDLMTNCFGTVELLAKLLVQGNTLDEAKTRLGL